MSKSRSASTTTLSLVRTSSRSIVQKHGKAVPSRYRHTGINISIDNLNEVKHSDTYHALQKMFVWLVYEFLHLGAPRCSFLFETCARGPIGKISHWVRLSKHVKEFTTKDPTKKYLQNGNTSTGQIPPPEAMRLERISTHSSASDRYLSSFEVTRYP